MRESLLTNDFEEKKEEKIDLGGSNDARNAFKGMNFDSDLDMAKALQQRYNSSNLNNDKPFTNNQLTSTNDTSNIPLNKQFDDEENILVRSADDATYDQLIGGPGERRGFNFCEYMCGRPEDNEDRINLGVCRARKRVVKNSAMFLTVLLIYVLFLSMIMGNKK